MTIDTDIELYRRNRKQYGQEALPPGVPRVQFGRGMVGMMPLTRQTPLDRLAKHMRYTAYKRHEAQQKQLQMLLDQRRNRVSEAWRTEYDRLRMHGNLSAEDQALVDSRINDMLQAGIVTAT